MKIQGHKIIYKILVGSHAYGTNVEGSDKDIKGIFIQSPESVLEEGYLPQIDVNKDEVYFEIGRFVDLVTGGNPTMLEMLFAPQDTILYVDPVMRILWDYTDQLLTKQLKWSFAGYAIDQIKKAAGLDKKMNWEEERKIRKTVLDFCYISRGQGKSQLLSEYLDHINIKQEDCGLVSIPNMRYCYALFAKSQSNWDLDQEENTWKGIIQDLDKSNDVSLSSIAKRDLEWYRGVVYFNKDGYSVHCKEYNSYLTWLKERNEQRYVDVKGHNQKIDGKNLLHCVRLLDVATEIAQGSSLNVRRPNAEYLKSIRKGQVSLEEIIKESQEKINNLDQLFNNSILPEKADKEFFKKLVIEIRKKIR